jgi:hypothetical protein
MDLYGSLTDAPSHLRQPLQHQQSQGCIAHTVTVATVDADAVPRASRGSFCACTNRCLGRYNQEEIGHIVFHFFSTILRPQSHLGRLPLRASGPLFCYG